MTRTRSLWIAGAMTSALLTTSLAFGQTPPPGPPQGAAARAQRPGRGRMALPAITPNMNQQQLQAWMDTYAVIQAESALQLTDEQFPNFVTRLRRLQDIRRRHMAERRRLMTEVRGLVAGTAAGRDDGIVERLRALDDMGQAAAADLRKAYLDLDAVLTPWQRGRFRIFEDQMEQKKVELLGKIKAG